MIKNPRRTARPELFSPVTSKPSERRGSSRLLTTLTRVPHVGQISADSRTSEPQPGQNDTMYSPYQPDITNCQCAIICRHDKYIYAAFADMCGKQKKKIGWLFYSNRFAQNLLLHTAKNGNRMNITIHIMAVPATGISPSRAMIQ